MRWLRYRWYRLTTVEMHWVGYTKPIAVVVFPDGPMWGAKWTHVKRWQVDAYERDGWRRGPLPPNGSLLNIPTEPERI